MEPKESYPNYYSVTPAEVRYSKKIGMGAKMLYGEITCLANKEGFCWATNGYFAKLYGKDPATISRWVQELLKAGFIRVEIVDMFLRKIYLEPLSMGVPQKRGGGNAKMQGGVPQKRNTNNTSDYSKKDSSPAVTAPFSLLEEIRKMEDSSRRDMNIIALYADERKRELTPKIINKDQLGLFVKRHLQAAGRLKSYTDKQLLDAFGQVKVKYKDIDWTLDTVSKELTK